MDRLWKQRTDDRVLFGSGVDKLLLSGEDSLIKDQKSATRDNHERRHNGYVDPWYIGLSASGMKQYVVSNDE
jgi:hypothetical protein